MSIIVHFNQCRDIYEIHAGNFCMFKIRLKSCDFYHLMVLQGKFAWPASDVIYYYYHYYYYYYYYYYHYHHDDDYYYFSTMTEALACLSHGFAPLTYRDAVGEKLFKVFSYQLSFLLSSSFRTQSFLTKLLSKSFRNGIIHFNHSLTNTVVFISAIYLNPTARSP